jgi:hypothetical protein
MPHSTAIETKVTARGPDSEAGVRLRLLERDLLQLDLDIKVAELVIQKAVEVGVVLSEHEAVAVEKIVVVGEEVGVGEEAFRANLPIATQNPPANPKLLITRLTETA